MTCETVRIGNTVGIICGVRGNAPKRRCAVAGCKNHGEVECDWKMGNGKTCDALVCRQHAQHVGPDKDLCPAHQVTYAAWLDAHPERDAR